MLRRLRFRVWFAMALFVGLDGVAHGVTLPQIDTFQDGTTNNWTDGQADNTSNVSTGGPGGVGDAFLQISSGSFGGKVKLVVFNQMQWTGNYAAAGVAAITMDLKNFGPTDLPMRITIREQTGGQAFPGYSSTTPFMLAADGGWHTAQFSLAASDMTAVNPFNIFPLAPYPTVLADVHDFRLLSAAAPAVIGDTIDAQIGVDNITAVAVSPSAWTGESSTSWADSGNWSGAVPGGTNTTTNADTALFNRNAARSPLTIDAGRNVQNVTFDTAGVNSLTVGAVDGPALLLTAGGTLQTTSTVASSQAVNAPLVLAGDYTFNSGAGSNSAVLSIGGGIVPRATAGATTLTLSGGNTGANTIGGVLADNGAGHLAVTKSGSGLWILSGANRYSGSTTVLGGTLKFDVTAAPTIAAGVTATVASGATLELAGSISALGTVDGNRVDLMNDSSAPGVVISGANQVVGDIDGSGTTQINAGSDLAADHFIQNSLMIGGTALNRGLVTIVASDASGNPLGQSSAQSSGLLLADSLASGVPFGAVINSSNLTGGPASGRSDSEFTSSSFGHAGSAVVPEPSSMLLVAIAAVSLLGHRIRRRWASGS